MPDPCSAVYIERHLVGQTQLEYNLAVELARDLPTIKVERRHIHTFVSGPSQQVIDFILLYAKTRDEMLPKWK